MRIMDLLVTGGMAFLAGATDIYGLGLLRDEFVSFMSGNTILLGAAIGEAEWWRASLLAGLVGLFVIGAAGGAILARLGGRQHTLTVAVAVTSLLALPMVRPSFELPSLVIAMGALNAAIDRLGQAAVSLTYVTGTLVKLGQGLGQAIIGYPSGFTWLWQLPMWMSLLAGAVAATAVRKIVGSEPWPLCALAALLALLSVQRGPDRGHDMRQEPSTSR